MIEFCKTCPHKDQPDVVKNFFQRYTWPNFFHDCPLSNEHIIGCTRKYVEIDWVDYVKKLKEKNLLPEDMEAVSNGE